MLRIRLLSALQVLTMPEGSMGAVTHKRAREVIRETLSLEELPAHNPTVQSTLEAYLASWLGLELA